MFYAYRPVESDRLTNDLGSLCDISARDTDTVIGAAFDKTMGRMSDKNRNLWGWEDDGTEADVSLCLLTRRRELKLIRQHSQELLLSRMHGPQFINTVNSQDFIYWPQYINTMKSKTVKSAIIPNI